MYDSTLGSSGPAPSTLPIITPFHSSPSSPPPRATGNQPHPADKEDKSKRNVERVSSSLETNEQNVHK
ncbi:hypothetical protein CY34DRAFT_799313 [Suillus luteus UH-Slu-Lm8-n1]|uniref:Uncharacterized protein n=1 Tax=Suillus luteus UH-Slu-Lm8-n1 TaxID=930992 RepID=A0A0D0BWU4_9AGAM|nr:hypothetical protein CY34DRAFT_799313 [Suillus luteus UH-Slu-Lm8-n1]